MRNVENWDKLKMKTERMLLKVQMQERLLRDILSGTISIMIKSSNIRGTRVSPDSRLIANKFSMKLKIEFMLISFF